MVRDHVGILSVVLFLNKTSMEMAIQWSTTLPCRFGIQGYIQVVNVYIRGLGWIIFMVLHSIVFYQDIHIFCDIGVIYWSYSLSLIPPSGHFGTYIFGHWCIIIIWNEQSLVFIQVKIPISYNRLKQCWVRIYRENINCCLLKEKIHQKTQLTFSLLTFEQTVVVH